MYLAFLGFRCAAIGYLVYRSTSIPRVIGVLFAFTALGHLKLLWPPFANALSPYNMAPVAPASCRSCSGSCWPA